MLIQYPAPSGENPGGHVEDPVAVPVVPETNTPNFPEVSGHVASAVINGIFSLFKNIEKAAS